MRGGPSRVLLRGTVATPAATLICVPYAGGSARSFTGLARHVPADWAVIAVQPSRAWTAGPRTLDSLADHYHGLLADDLATPCLVLGHSLGAVAVHRMTMRHSATWPAETRIVLSAPAPRAGSAALTALSDEALLSEAVASGMISRLPGPRDAAMRLVMPALRADIAALRAGWDPVPVGVPAYLLGGTRDRLCPPEELQRIGAALGARGTAVINGGHAYMDEDPSQVARALIDIATPLRARSQAPAAPETGQP